MSEAERMIAPLNAYLKTQNVLYEILDEAKISVFRFEGLSSKLSSGDGTAAIQQRVQMMNEIKSVTNALMLDMKDEFEQKTLAMGGMSEVMKDNRIGIAAALRMPVTKLFGISASGFNTGESDLESYNMMVESDIRAPMKSMVRQLVELNMWHLWGRKADFTIKWPSLRLLTSQEEETVKDSKFNRAIVAYERGLISPSEWGEIMQNENLISIKTKAGDGILPDAPIPPPAPATMAQNSFKVTRNKRD